MLIVNALGGKHVAWNGIRSSTRKTVEATIRNAAYHVFHPAPLVNK